MERYPRATVVVLRVAGSSRKIRRPGFETTYSVPFGASATLVASPLQSRVTAPDGEVAVTPAPCSTAPA
jgi:hypothetical protein